MANARLSSSELARQTGIPAGTIKRIRNNVANPTIETLLPLAQYFSVSVSELLGDATLNIVKTFGLKKIPLLTCQECVLSNRIDNSPDSRYILTERQVSENGFALQIDNNDLDFFPKDSLLIVEPEQKPKSGDYVAVTKKGQDTAWIRKYICEIDHIYLGPLVKGINITPLTSEFMILGVIIQYRMELSPEIN